jgi:hypothetical protein
MIVVNNKFSSFVCQMARDILVDRNQLHANYGFEGPSATKEIMISCRQTPELSSEMILSSREQKHYYPAGVVEKHYFVLSEKLRELSGTKNLDE